MIQKNSLTRFAIVVLALFALVALAACGTNTAAPKPTVRSAAPINPPAQSNPPSAQTQAAPPAAQLAEPTAALGGEGAPGAEGGRPEGGPSVASVTDPGGLPPSPATNDPLINQIGEERMVVYHDSQNRYQVLFVNGWQTSPGDVTDSVKSTNQDRNAQIAIVNSGGKSATEYATADEAKLKASVPSYQTIVLKPGQTPYGAVASLIYRYQAGQNPVTGKGLNYIAARVYVPRQGSSDLAIISVTGPAQFYGDLSAIFDRVVNSFKWL